MPWKKMNIFDVNVAKTEEMIYYNKSNLCRFLAFLKGDGYILLNQQLTF
jgi:hypothetical protein